MNITNKCPDGVPVKIEIDENGERVKIWMKGPKKHWTITNMQIQTLWYDKDYWRENIGLPEENRPNNPINLATIMQ